MQHIKSFLSNGQKVTTLLLVAMLYMSMMTCCTSTHPNANNHYLVILDSLLECCDELEETKLIRIGELKEKLDNASSLSDKYLINTLLFDEYRTYQSDSAMKYADARINLAKLANNSEWEILSRLGQADLLTGTGLLTKAAEAMNSINRSELSRDMLIDYYGQMIYLYSHLGNYNGGDFNDFYRKERAYKDSIMSIIDESHPDYLWYKGWDVLGVSKSSDEVIKALGDKLSDSEFNTRRNAQDAYILSKLYEQANDYHNAKKYMILSAISDVRCVNAEIASLEDLAKIMFAEGDIDHAYSYINYSLNKAISYPNRVRAFGISETIDEVNNAYAERSRQQQKRVLLFLITLGVLALILAALIVVIIIQNRSLRRQGGSLDSANKNLSNKISELSEAQSQLNDANALLKELNEDLKAKNEELKEANYVKEEYIGYVFTICSNYIGKLEGLKRNIHLKAVTGKFKEIESETADIDMKDELRDFYRSFDTIFLHIYPNFVNDFNTLLQEDKRIIPKEGELLNTELRIYALVRLGITDSVKIAEFLHCSVQTVYNNRFKVRNKALMAKKNFADAVRTLGNYIQPTS